VPGRFQQRRLARPVVTTSMRFLAQLYRTTGGRT
jgi:hypothetical protein